MTPVRRRISRLSRAWGYSTRPASRSPWRDSVGGEGASDSGRWQSRLALCVCRRPRRSGQRLELGGAQDIKDMLKFVIHAGPERAVISDVTEGAPSAADLPDVEAAVGALWPMGAELKHREPGRPASLAGGLRRRWAVGRWSSPVTIVGSAGAAPGTVVVTSRSAVVIEVSDVAWMVQTQPVVLVQDVAALPLRDGSHPQGRRCSHGGSANPTSTPWRRYSLFGPTAQPSRPRLPAWRTLGHRSPTRRRAAGRGGRFGMERHRAEAGRRV